MGFFRDRDGLFWARSENPENPEIPSKKFNRDFIPGIRDFNLRDSGFFLISGFLFPGFSKNLRNAGFFEFRDFCPQDSRDSGFLSSEYFGDFFVG